MKPDPGDLPFPPTMRPKNGLFVPGRDLEVFSSPEQTLEIVGHYLNNRDELSKARKNAPVSI
jgi:spore maturation protein CgeB